MKPLDVLHLHSTFAPGGAQLRAVRLMNAWGPRARHTVVSARQGVLGARDALNPEVDVAFPADAPPLAGPRGPKRWRALADYMRPFDLVLTYGWGAMDGVFARRRCSGPPLVHHEDELCPDEIVRRKLKRNLYRRIALRGAHALAVPSRQLERIARCEWGRQATRIANGVDVDRFAAREPGRTGANRAVVGTLACLGPVENVPMLVRAVARVPDVELRVPGHGPERMNVACQAHRAGLGARLTMMDLEDPATVLPRFDIYALSSHAEQAPVSLIQAMAAGLPVVATDVGDVRAILSPENAPFVVPPGDEAAFSGALATLAADPALRARLGEANRARARTEFDEAGMIERFAVLYEEAAGRPGELTRVLASPVQSY